MVKPKAEVVNKAKKVDNEKAKPRHPSPTNPDTADGVTLADLQRDETLWYRLKVLLYDLSHITKDPSCEQRLSSTTNELYISEPYFLESEAFRIRSTLITSNSDEDGELVTIEKALQQSLHDFLSKRRASGDARPCGPHDLLPVYASVFGIDKEALKDGKFLARLRRSGLGIQTQQKEAQSNEKVKAGGAKESPGKSKKSR